DEQDAANASTRAAARALARRLPPRGRGVDGALTREDKVVRRGIEPQKVQNHSRSRPQLGAERRERRAETARRARAGNIGVGSERGEAGLELPQLLWSRALLRREDAPRVEQRDVDLPRNVRPPRPLREGFQPP